MEFFGLITISFGNTCFFVNHLFLRNYSELKAYMFAMFFFWLLDTSIEAYNVLHTKTFARALCWLLENGVVISEGRLKLICFH